LLRRIARQARNAARARDLYAPPGHFYSPTTNAEDRRRQLEWDRHSQVPGVDLREDAQLALARRIVEVGHLAPLRWNESSVNQMFGRIDATVLQGVLTVLRPSRIVEIGSGFSTAVMLDTADHMGTTRAITCVEPYPERLHSLLRPADDVILIARPVQDVPLDTFTELGDRDLLFIDSTHVAKSGSDVLYLYLEVLPQLPPGVFVHVHDIFWPFSYREEWLAQARDWTEAYLLRALMTDSERWQMELFNDWLYLHHPEVAGAITQGTDRPGSVYLRRLGPIGRSNDQGPE
jgi:predicted O-methyltransferase YrrM